jgi:hypothetical protein
MNTSFENGKVRSTIGSMMIADLDSDLQEWLSVGLWETDLNHKCWPDYPVVFKELKKKLELNKNLSRPVTVIYVCGSDHATKCGLGHGKRSDGVGIVTV